MRESVGGAFLIQIMVVFIILYNLLLGIAVNYAMVFRVKNQIINLLEEYEGCAGAQTHIEDYIANVGYYRARDSSGGAFTIVPTTNARGTYYTVSTYLQFTFPMIGSSLEFRIPGETKIVYGVTESESDCSY